jgi:hypothetical protein
MFMWGWDWGWGGLWSFFWVVFVIAIFVIPWLFFLLNLRSLLECVSPPNRAMSPDMVWLNFIPVFNFGWFIYTVAKVRDSVRAEYDSRYWTREGDYGYNVGLAAGILGICSAVFGWIPLLGWGVSVAALVAWIIYWLKTADLKSRLGYGSPTPYGMHGNYDSSHGQVRWSPAPPPGPASTQPGPASTPPAPQAPSAGAGGSSAGGNGGEDALRGSPATVGTVGGAGEARRCAVCNTPVSPEDRFCRGCGLPLSSPR